MRCSSHHRTTGLVDDEEASPWGCLTAERLGTGVGSRARESSEAWESTGTARERLSTGRSSRARESAMAREATAGRERLRGGISGRARESTESGEATGVERLGTGVGRATAELSGTGNTGNRSIDRDQTLVCTDPPPLPWLVDETLEPTATPCPPPPKREADAKLPPFGPYELTEPTPFET
uniref:Uncharacterized protein n=1 Tax=Anopheles farauti TaxID=69004 RepID=A0A182QTC5_9DIPT